MKGRQKPPAPVPAPQDVQPATNQSGDDAIIQPLDLGREHDGIPHGWSPAYWKYVTVSTHSSLIVACPVSLACTELQSQAGLECTIVRNLMVLLSTCKCGREEY